MKYYHELFNFMSVILKHCLSLLTQYLRWDGGGGTERKYLGQKIRELGRKMHCEAAADR